MCVVRIDRLRPPAAQHRVGGAAIPPDLPAKRDCLLCRASPDAEVRNHGACWARNRVCNHTIVTQQ
eukprot:365387-Chlamydomonas_euryale.AAC.9